jgi:hypothetical protein
MVQAGSIEPFEIDFDYVMSIIRKHYPGVNSIEEFCLDANAIKELSSVLERQNEWITHQSSTLYKDPFMLNQQLMKMDISVIADAFLKSWHPIIEMEQISARTLAESMGYWGDLLPIDERWSDPTVEPKDTQFASIQEAQRLGLIPEEGFTDIIEAFWRELGERVGEEGKIDYWNWIGSESFEETIRRAYLTVFMVSYGYANIQWYQLLEETVIIYNKEVKPNPDTSKISLTVMVDYEEWKLWQKLTGHE